MSGCTQPARGCHAEPPPGAEWLATQVDQRDCYSRTPVRVCFQASGNAPPTWAAPRMQERHAHAKDPIALVRAAQHRADQHARTNGPTFTKPRPDDSNTSRCARSMLHDPIRQDGTITFKMSNTMLSWFMIRFHGRLEDICSRNGLSRTILDQNGCDPKWQGADLGPRGRGPGARAPSPAPPAINDRLLVCPRPRFGRSAPAARS